MLSDEESEASDAADVSAVLSAEGGSVGIAGGRGESQRRGAGLSGSLPSASSS